MDTLKYSIGEIVYLKINPDPEERGCYEIELTSEPSFVTSDAD